MCDTRVLIVGDTHGHMDHLLGLIRHKEPDLVLQAGDFGFWPWIELPAFPVPVHWCDGNHEDHGKLAALRASLDGGPPRAHEVAPNCFWQDRGSTLTLPDGRVVMFLGGADSIDKELRKEGRDWFPGEVMTRADLARLPDVHVDIVVSHTVPESFPLIKFGVDGSIKDPTRHVLSLAFKKYRPRLWFAGHFHQRTTGEHDGCRWVALSSSEPMEACDPTWWEWLPEMRR